MVDSDGDALGLRCWCGEEETVVADVLAVRGRSAEASATAALSLVLLFIIAAVWEVTYSPPYTISSRGMKFRTSRALLLFFKFVTFFPERSRSSRSVDIVVPSSYSISKISTA